MDFHMVRPKRLSPPSHTPATTSPTSSELISSSWLLRAQMPLSSLVT